MKTVRVNLKENPYDILIGHQMLGKLGERINKLKIGSDALIITHPSISRRYAPTLKRSLQKSGITPKVFLVPEGEQSKSAQAAFDLISKIAKYSTLKKPFIIALGGGVIGDLAGYVAAAYRRGIPYIQVPTSFLAQIDSAIGGKVGIDLPEGKNLVGAFYQPKLVASDVRCLATLPKKQIRNGLAEAIKYGIIDDKSLFIFIEKNLTVLLEGNTDKLTELVVRCSRIKGKVVVADEKETKGIRSILNFGHTIGHAIEAADGYKNYQHGEAIALGMRCAAHISHQLKILSAADKERIEELLSKAGLPHQIRHVKTLAILKAMRHDKKFITGKNRFVLATAIGQVRLKEGIPPSVIKKAIAAYK